MSKKKIFIVMLLCLCLVLTGCGNKEDGGGLSIVGPKPVKFAAGEFDPETTTELAITLQPGEAELLSGLSLLESADFSGSENIEEIYNWALNNPQVDVKYTVSLPDGTVLDNSTDSVDMSQMDGSTVSAALENLKFLPELEHIELGWERQGLSWDDVGLIQSTLPEAKINYVFNIYGMDVELENTQLNLSHIPVDDDCVSLLKAMEHMPNLVYLDMDSCGVPNEKMASIRDAYPDVKVVWRVWFGEWDVYSVRTDVERILASTPSVAGEIYPGNCESLQYCTEVKYLDLGHNTNMTDISFVAHMPKLEVAILAMGNWSDASPLANCENLEYLEMQTTLCLDLSPLANLKNLRHLNIAYIPDLTDISPLYSLTELERLWLGCNNYVPAEQVAQMQAAAPNCEINVDVYTDPTGGRWRYVDYNDLAYIFILHPRFELLREQFGNYEASAFSYSWNDPLY